MAILCQKLFLFAVLWSRGGFKLGVADKGVYVTSQNLLGNSEAAKYIHLLRNYHSYVLEAQFCRPVFINASEWKRACDSSEDFGVERIGGIWELSPQNDFKKQLVGTTKILKDILESVERNRTLEKAGWDAIIYIYKRKVAIEM